MQVLSHFVDPYDKNKFIKEYKNYIHAHGGDGTLIRAVSMHRNKNKPFFGSAAGTANFMMNNEKSFTNKSTTIELYTIHADITFIEEGIQKTESYEAFNEVALGGDMGSWINFSIRDHFFGEFKGSGVVFSTAQGSTSMNKNNYGKILPLPSILWSVTGNMTNKVINNLIDPRELTIDVVSRTSVSVWIDGHNNKIVHNVVSVSISKGTLVRLIFNDLEEFKRKRI